MKFKSALVTQVSGSIGGATYAHNQGGLYVRARSIPVNTNTEYQQAVRNYVAQLTSAWNNALSAAQRAAWELYAEQVPLPDAFGDPRCVSGLAHYVRSNVPRLQAALARVDDGPTDYTLPEATGLSIDDIDETAEEIDIAFETSDAWVEEDGAALLVYVSRPQNVTINYFKGPYRYAGKIAGSPPALPAAGGSPVLAPPTSPATLSLPFPVVAGQKVFAKMNLTRADGRYGSPFRDSLIVPPAA